MQFQGQYFSYILTIVAHNIFISGFIYANQNLLSPIQTNLLRGIATFIINFFIIKYYKLNMDYKISKNHKYLLIRSGSICIHSLTIALCGFYLPQPVIHTINSTGPIFVIIEDYFINKIKINKQQLQGIILSFIGIFLTINGQNISTIFVQDYQGSTSNSKFENYLAESSFQKVLMGGLLSSVAIIWAYGTIVVKNIVQLNSLHISLHMGIFFVIVNGLLYPIFVTNPVSLSTMIWGLFLCGVPIAVGNILYIHALTINKNTGIVALCTTSAVFVGYLISIFRYNQSLNLICALGSISIVFGIYIAVTGKKTLKQSLQPIQQNLIQNPQTTQTTKQQYQLQAITVYQNPQLKKQISR